MITAFNSVRISFNLPKNTKEDKDIILDFCDFINKVFKNCDFKVMGSMFHIHFVANQAAYMKHKQALLTCYTLFKTESRFKNMQMHVQKQTPVLSY